LEAANLKLSSGATDGLGVSGRDRLPAILPGQDDPVARAGLAKGRLRPQIGELEPALNRRVKDRHRRLLKLPLEPIDDLNAKVQPLEAELARLLPPFDPDDLLARWQTIPAVGQKVAQIMVAEAGTDMTRLARARQLAAGAGLTPGKNERAGPNRWARTRKANRSLKTALVEAANRLSRSHDPFRAVRCQRWKARRGQQGAAVALARSILESAYSLIVPGGVYIDWGAP
jgi:transposase